MGPAARGEGWGADARFTPLHPACLERRVPSWPCTDMVVGRNQQTFCGLWSLRCPLAPALLASCLPCGAVPKLNLPSNAVSDSHAMPRSPQHAIPQAKARRARHRTACLASAASAAACCRRSFTPSATASRRDCSPCSIVADQADILNEIGKHEQHSQLCALLLAWSERGLDIDRPPPDGPSGPHRAWCLPGCVAGPGASRPPSCTCSGGPGRFTLPLPVSTVFEVSTRSGVA